MTELAGGDIAGAIDSYLTGYEYLDVVVPELFIIGTAAGFGLCQRRPVHGSRISSARSVAGRGE
jgi:hypothetical protein